METISRQSKLIFAFGGLGKDAMFAMSTVMMFYFTALIGVSPLFVGTMMMVVRVWDAINDPIMGGIVANTNTRMGKFRPWILIGSFLNAIVLVFVFLNPNLGVDTLRMFVYITVVYTLWGMTYTLMDIPYWSMIPALSQSQKERESITVITRFFTSIGFFIIAAGYLNLASFLSGSDTPSGQIRGLFYLSIIVSIVFFLSELLLVFNVKEKIVPKDESRVTLKQMFELLKNNDQLLVVMMTVLITNFVLFTTSGMAVYFITYDIGNQNLFALFIGIGGVLQVIGALCFPVFKKKLKRKQIFNISIFLQVVGFVLLFVNAFVLNNFIIFVFVFGALIFFGQGLQMVLQTVLLSDTVEYGEHKLGQRNEALAFSVQTFIVKLATGISLGIIGIGLQIFRFVPAIEDVVQPQSQSTIIGMRLLMFIIPIIGLIIGLTIFNKKHKLDEVLYEKIISELKERGQYVQSGLEL